MLTRFIGAVAIAAATTAAHAGEARMVTLDVKGMDCAACPVTVKVVLMRQPGVAAVKMDAQQHTAVVRFDPTRVSAKDLAQAVTVAGFPTSPRR